MNKFQEKAEPYTALSNAALTSVPHAPTCDMTGEQLHQWAQANGGDLPMDATRDDYQRAINYCKAQARYHAAIAAAVQELKESTGCRPANY